MSAGGPSIDLRDQRGETLLELLITLILMSVAVIGILAGVLAVARLSDHNARTTFLGNSAQSYAEEIKQPVDSFSYSPCATAYPAFGGTLPNASNPSALADYSATVTGIQYLVAPPSGAPTSVATWTSTPCASATNDRGLQRLTITVRVDDGASVQTETVTVIKRNARCTYSVAYENTDQGPC